MPLSEKSKDEELLACARNFVNAKTDYVFTPREKLALGQFFTNDDKKVLFIHSLPTSVTSALLAMYSRLKNPRGLRGHFVDNLLPLLLTTFLKQFQNLADPKDVKKIADYIKENYLATLDKFCEFNKEHEAAFSQFLDAVHLNPDYVCRLSDSPKVKAFLGLYLDAYGHNSIARTANLVLGIEDVSILTAKSLEWGRPGAGYIELSTRYVDFSRKSTYPIEAELEIIGGKDLAGAVGSVISDSVDYYIKMFGDSKGQGILSRFFTEQFEKLLDQKDVKTGAFGESCDVAGNFLPCATLTSLGISISGESFPELLKHLTLDDTYENRALVELILSESEKVGGGNFSKHLETSDWRRQSWQYLDHENFQEGNFLPSSDLAENTLLKLFRSIEDFSDCANFEDLVAKINSAERHSYDKLPNQFEFLTAVFARKMSFRSWRDIHRQGFCTHLRALVTPRIGFYKYDKPAPPELQDGFQAIWNANRQIWDEMAKRGVPPIIRQYPMAMGNLVGFQIGGNLLQWEFVNWQRTKFSVNHEVRQVVLSIENALRREYPWWSKLSRADMTSAYICARGSKGIALHN